jgi:hypothetical protein
MISAIVLALGVLLLVGPMALTGWGAHRRGRRPAVAVLSGLFFPVAWVAWYLRDEHPSRYRAVADRGRS